MNRIITICTILPLLGLALLAQAASAQTFYRWVDEQGVTHYSESAPEGEESREVRTWGQGSDRRQRQGGGDREAGNPPARAGSNRQQTPAEPAVPPVDEAYCKQLRDNLETLTNRPVVRMEDPDTGEVTTLDTEARQKMLDDTRERLRACN
ncbi:DUF4124 domain-containing protein [Alcanivorax sp. JB21]|uniref:DUF4124 domain-containing protein n=1 Tax=Alcanivorax limicola TaxID=2874102 RepID=UPI001CBF2E93|nr:DUF4124 domain-containing protein [Alcanivorax limicola]MBZ2190536.1 DUF4124 domain-containing protein [Alcanivorax limicola]